MFEEGIFVPKLIVVVCVVFAVIIRLTIAPVAGVAGPFIVILAAPEGGEQVSVIVCDVVMDPRVTAI